jgi:hypothetical protein
MTQRTLQRTAAAAALAMVLALAAPAHAASRHGRTADPGWMGALQWLTQIWLGIPAGNGLDPDAARTAPNTKADIGIGIDPDGARTTTKPPATNGDKGIGIDPDG